MCGIAGVLGAPQGGSRQAVQAMADALAHRGPDGEGAWTDEEAGVALGHRRLAILDLSAAGHQPMASASGRLVLVLNGEIYNYREVQAELESAGPLRLRGHSDTEVLLEAIERWGVRGALERLVGMFAFAVWDRRERVLTLARDRFGEKPLCYGEAGGAFLFGSELKALRAFPGFQPRIDRAALREYFRFGCVPAPLALYEGTAKLPPGTLLRVRPGQRLGDLKPEPYWSVADATARGQADPFQGSEVEAADRLEALLRVAVRDCMVSDVPLGVFLSGGVDSSTVAALMQAQSQRPVRTFSIGFEDPAHDESAHARAVAAHLGTDHTQLLVTEREMLEAVRELPRIYDEPFADSSQIPTFLVARLARPHVTVALTGDGGDEAFGGYSRYVHAARLWRRLARVPRPARRMAAALARSLPPKAWDALLLPLRPLWRRRIRAGAVGGWVHRAAAAAQAPDLDAFHRCLVSTWQEPEALVQGAPAVPHEASPPGGRTVEERMMLLDTLGYLPNDILAKVDRASMAVALETRAPLLDWRVVAFAWTLPPGLRVRGGEGKPLLKRVLHRHVPRELVERPKQGFAVPLAAWLRGPLRGLAEACFAEDRLRREGFLRPEPVRRAWDEHLAGRRDRSAELWTVLMFQLWLQAQGARDPAAPAGSTGPAVTLWEGGPEPTRGPTPASGGAPVRRGASSTPPPGPGRPP